MRIEQKTEGWTVTDVTGRVMLVNEKRDAAYLPTRRDVLDQCHYAGLYEGKDGTLLELVIGKRDEEQCGSSHGSVPATTLEVSPASAALDCDFPAALGQ